MNSKAYKSLAIIVGLSFIIMYLLVFVSVNAWRDITFFNLRNFYMAVIMVSPMVILMLFLMSHMFESKKINIFLYWGSAAIFIIIFFFIRQQFLVDDRQLIKSMIPHHSSAITMCQEADLSDSQVRELCDEIIANQQKEIDEMNNILKRLN